MGKKRKNFSPHFENALKKNNTTFCHCYASALCALAAEFRDEGLSLSGLPRQSFAEADLRVKHEGDIGATFVSSTEVT